jgi:hypothetical protein
MGILPLFIASSKNAKRCTTDTREYCQSPVPEKKGFSGLQGVLGLDFFSCYSVDVFPGYQASLKDG